MNLCIAPTHMVNLSCVARAARAVATFVRLLETRVARELATASCVVLGMDAVAILAWLLEASVAMGWACHTLSRRAPHAPANLCIAPTHMVNLSCVARAARAAATFVQPLETRAAKGLATASCVVLG